MKNEWIGVVGSILTLGSYGVLIKSQSLQRLQLDMIVFQIYFSLGTCITGIAVLIALRFQHFQFSAWGLVGAVMWTVLQLFACTSSKFAIEYMALYQNKIWNMEMAMVVCTISTLIWSRKLL